MVHSMSARNIDFLYHQPDLAAFGRVRSDIPSARIVDIEVLKEKPVVSAATGQDKVSPRLAAMRTRAANAAVTICVTSSPPYSNAQSATGSASDVARQAWLRAQTDDAEASRMESFTAQLNIYA